MLTDRQWFLCATLLYGLGMMYSVFLWRKGFRKDDRIHYFLLLAGFALNTTAMFMRGFSFNRCPVNNLFEATMFVDWSAVGVYLILGLWQKFRFVGAFASPIFLFLGIFALMPGLDHQDPEGQITKNWAVSLHAVLILFSYGAFGLGAVASCMYLIQERHLKTHNILAILSKLPSIERLESIASRLVLAGVILLSVGLSFAPFLGQPDRPLAWYQDAKVIWSIVIWATYVGVVSSRYLWRFGGRPMAWALIACFVFLILTFSGTNLMSEMHQ